MIRPRRTTHGLVVTQGRPEKGNLTRVADRAPAPRIGSPPLRPYADIVGVRHYAPSVLESLDAPAIRRWSAAGLTALRRHQQEINELNVFPVPDSDTGTNLVLTLSAADAALAARPGIDGLGAALGCLAHGALLGARGNSGVILAQVLRACAESLAAEPAAGRSLARALSAAAVAARAAVAQPVPGTMLTIMDAAAQAAVALDSDELSAVATAAVDAAATALLHTPDQLPELARAGVVDAGGRGLVILLAALAEVVTGRPAEYGGPLPVAAGHHVARVAREAGSEEFAYEVQFLLDAPAGRIAPLRAALGGLGDSLVVVGADSPDGGAPPVWNVHVHVNDVGAAIEAGIEAGRPHRISVTRFADGPQPSPGAPRPAGAPVQPEAPVPPGVVVVAHGCPGLVGLFTAEGASALTGAAPPDADGILAAIRGVGGDRVVLLPNDRALHAAAAEAASRARDEGIQVGVVPSRSPVQALAALAVRDPGRRFEDDVIAMAEAAGACRHAELTVATGDALTVAGRATAGDIVALVDGEVNVIGAGSGLVEVAVTVLDRMLGSGGELVTLVTGADAPDGLAAALTGHLAAAWPFVEARAYEGGQCDSPLLLGVE